LSASGAAAQFNEQALHCVRQDARYGAELALQTTKTGTGTMR